MEVAIRDSLHSVMQEFDKLFKETHPNGTSGELYRKWIDEEDAELKAEKAGTPNHFKELCDSIWVRFMYAEELGYPLAEGFAELYREYRSKFYDKNGNYHPTYREDGKLLKGEGFKKANFEQFF